MSVGLELHHQRREILIARCEAEGVQFLRVEQFHGVDHQRNVGGVLAGRIAELLNGPDRKIVQLVFPVVEARARPIAIGAPNVGGALFGKLRQHVGNLAMRHIVRVDQQCDPAIRAVPRAIIYFHYSVCPRRHNIAVIIARKRDKRHPQ